MDFKRLDVILGCWLLLILFGCGQVGFITGGDVDVTAPRPIEDKISPPMASKNTFPKKISIPFDEFIALNSPGQNIRVVPDDVRLEAKIKKKSLVLTPVKGKWEENTTYAIYLKRAVKDITEGNDSLMAYVFSTGPTIDSLVAAVRVVDAYKNEPLKEITVGLYQQRLLDDTSKVLPRYVAQTNQEGIAEFSYLQEGPFYVYAFYDENKNNFLDTREKRGMLPFEIYADTVVTTVPELRLMPPPPPREFKVKNSEVLPPATWAISFSKPIKKEQFNPIGTLPVGEIWNKRMDSVTLFYGKVGRSGRFNAVVEHDNSYDTIFKKYFFKKPIAYNYGTNLLRGVLTITDTLTLHLDEAIEEVNPRFLTIQGKKEGDSLRTDLPVTYFMPRPDEVQFYHERSFDSVFVKLEPGAVNGYNFIQEDSIIINYPLQKAANVGNVRVEFDTIPEYGILEMLNSKKEVIRSAIFDGIISVEFEYMQPGDYTFRYIIDTNRDGRWTTGNIFTETPAETVIWYKEPTTVRANWDIDVKLQLEKEEEEVEEEIEEVPEEEGE
jgi:uncharacterized protein (DUF2141 family)